MTGKDISLRIGHALRLAPALLRRDPIFRYAAIGALMALVVLVGPRRPGLGRPRTDSGHAGFRDRASVGDGTRCAGSPATAACDRAGHSARPLPRWRHDRPGARRRLRQAAATLATLRLKRPF